MNMMGARVQDGRAPMSELRQATQDNFEYLAATLSRRTAGKKYENYVVNAIWNALADATLQPVTQQFVDRRVRQSGLALVDLGGSRRGEESARRAYVDLYFPALRLGVEVDEGHHFAGDGPEADQLRRADIERAIPDYEEVRVAVEDRTGAVSPSQVWEGIDRAVRRIKERKTEVESGAFEWADAGSVVWPSNVPDWKRACGAGVLRAADGLLFRTNGEIRELFGVGNGEGTRSSNFSTNVELTNSTDVVWCPTLAVQDASGEFRTTNSGGWLNWIITEGDDVLIGQAAPSAASEQARRVAEHEGAPTPPWAYDLPEDEAHARAATPDWEPEPWSVDGRRWDGARRITFVRTRDAVGRKGFQFLGVFSPPVGHRRVGDVWFEVCRLVSDAVDLPRPGVRTR